MGGEKWEYSVKRYLYYTWSSIVLFDGGLSLKCILPSIGQTLKKLLKIIDMLRGKIKWNH